MSPGARPLLGDWLKAAATCLAAAVSLVSDAWAEPRVLHELLAGKDYEGAIQRVAIDARGNAWLSTSDTLYRVRNGRASIVERAVPGDTQFALAPAGGLYARLVHGNAPWGLFTIELVGLARHRPAVELRLPDFPFGFGTFYIGGEGQLIVTATPLDNAEGVGGEFLYAFWSDDGRMLSKVKLDGPRLGVMDVAGDALLLLGESDAVAFRHDGRRLWRIQGNFRNGALAAGGTVALLNPAEDGAIDEILVVQNGTSATVKMPSPVHDLALAANGRNGAVALDEGVLHFLAPRSCQVSRCDTRAAPPLPVAGKFYISAIAFLDSTNVAVGVFQRTATAPRNVYASGAILVTNTAGRIEMNVPVALEQPPMWTPSIDVTFEAPLFVARTRQKALLIRLDH